MHMNPGILLLKLAHFGRRSWHRLKGMNFTCGPHSFCEFLGVVAHVGANVEHTHARLEADHHRRIKAGFIALGDTAIERAGLDQPQNAKRTQGAA